MKKTATLNKAKELNLKEMQEINGGGGYSLSDGDNRPPLAVINESLVILSPMARVIGTLFSALLDKR